MTRDNIIRMALDAGIPIDVDWAGRPSTLVVKDGGTYLRGVDDLIRFAALVAAAEREACAKLAEPSEEHRREASWGYIGGEEGVELLDNLAAAIRARGET